MQRFFSRQWHLPIILVLSLQLMAAGGYTVSGPINLDGGVTGTLGAANGGTDLDTSGSSGIPSINAGTWAINNVLTANQVLFGAAGNTVSSSASLVFDGTALGVGATLYGSRAITVDTGGVLNIALSSAAGDDFTVDVAKLVVEGDTGYVGLGVANPSDFSDEFVVAQSNTASITVVNNAVGDWTLRKIRSDLSGVMGIYDPTGFGAMALYAGGSERIRILGDGRVGVGTGGPVYELEVASANAAGTQIAIGNSNGTANVWSLQADVNDGLQIIDRSAGASRGMIDANGEWGINDSTPDGQLDVQSRAAGVIPLVIQHAATPSVDFFNVLDSGGTKQMYLTSDYNFIIEEDAAAEVPNFEWDGPNDKFRTRSAIFAELEDPVDIAMRRKPTIGGMGSGENVGLLYAQPWDNTDFDGSGGTGRIGQIYFRTAEVPSQTERGGSLHLATTPNGALEPTDRIIIGNDGNTIAGNTGASTAATWHVRGTAAGTVAARFDSAASPSADVLRIYADGNLRTKVDSLGRLGAVGAGDVTLDGHLHVNHTTVHEPTDTPISCSATTEGGMYYDNSANRYCFCDGANWLQFDDSSTTC